VLRPINIARINEVAEANAKSEWVAFNHKVIVPLVELSIVGRRGGLTTGDMLCGASAAGATSDNSSSRRREGGSRNWSDGSGFTATWKFQWCPSRSSVLRGTIASLLALLENVN